MYGNALAHHGIKGQRWGIRRYQNEDGSLTLAGRARYMNGNGDLNKAGKKYISEQYSKLQKKSNRAYKKYSRKIDDKAKDRTLDEVIDRAVDKSVDSADAWNDFYNKTYVKNYNDLVGEFYKNDKSYQKALNLIKKYDMTSWNKTVKAEYANILSIENQIASMKKK